MKTFLISFLLMTATAFGAYSPFTPAATGIGVDSNGVLIDRNAWGYEGDTNDSNEISFGVIGTVGADIDYTLNPAKCAGTYTLATLCDIPAPDGDGIYSGSGSIPACGVSVTNDEGFVIIGEGIYSLIQTQGDVCGISTATLASQATGLNGCASMNVVACSVGTGTLGVATTNITAVGDGSNILNMTATGGISNVITVGADSLNFCGAISQSNSCISAAAGAINFLINDFVSLGTITDCIANTHTGEYTGYDFQSIECIDVNSTGRNAGYVFYAEHIQGTCNSVVEFSTMILERENENGTFTDSAHLKIERPVFSACTTVVENYGIFMEPMTPLSGTATDSISISVVDNIEIRSGGGNFVGDQANLRQLQLSERSSDPAQPAEGTSVVWMSDGTGKGDDGDILAASTAGGSTTYTIIHDHSAGTAW
jgi:hypothetical protein